MICDSRECREYDVILALPFSLKSRNPCLHLGWPQRRQRHAAELVHDLVKMGAGLAHRGFAVHLVALDP